MKNAALEQVCYTIEAEAILSPITDKKAIEKVKGVVPNNTKLANLWALCTLESY